MIWAIGIATVILILAGASWMNSAQGAPPAKASSVPEPIFKWTEVARLEPEKPRIPTAHEAMDAMFTIRERLRGTGGTPEEIKALCEKFDSLLMREEVAQ